MPSPHNPYRTMPILPTDAKERKRLPIASGVLDYFPDALLDIANLSRIGNDQHNPGEPLHWAREKSTDQSDTIIRHFMERGSVDSDGVRHLTKAAWRMLALLQLEIEADRETRVEPDYYPYDYDMDDEPVDLDIPDDKIPF